MFSRVRVATFLLGSLCVTFCLQARNRAAEPNDLSESPLTADQVVDRAIAREHQEVKEISSYTPVIETYIQEVRPDPKLGMVPRSDFHFFGQADLSHGVKVHSMFERSWKDWFRIWNFEPAGFVQMVFIDRQDFDRAHYVFANKRQRFLGDVRCYVIDVKPAPKARGALISSHLGNQVYFAEQLLQAAPALDPLSTTQIAALPLGSRVKIDPWSGSVTLVKPKPANLFSPRDKIPFEVVPMVPYLMRYTEPPASQTPEPIAPKPADPSPPHP